MYILLNLIPWLQGAPPTGQRHPAGNPGFPYEPDMRGVEIPWWYGWMALAVIAVLAVIIWWELRRKTSAEEAFENARASRSKFVIERATSQ